MLFLRQRCRGPGFQDAVTTWQRVEAKHLGVAISLPSNLQQRSHTTHTGYDRMCQPDCCNPFAPGHQQEATSLPVTHHFQCYQTHHCYEGYTHTTIKAHVATNQVGAAFLLLQSCLWP